MRDLTKLTRDEIGKTEWAEIRRRLERLEKCEAALRLCLEALGKWQENAMEEYADAQDAARAALEGK